MSKLLLFQLITIKNCQLSTLSEPNLQLQIQKFWIVFPYSISTYTKAIMSFPKGSAVDPDEIVPQIFKDLISKSNDSAGLNFLISLTQLINLIGE